jgi:hypothetical protein
MQKNKISRVFERVASLIPLLGIIGLALLFPVIAIGSVVWVVIAGTTPDILSLWPAISLGILIGVIVLSIGVAAASWGSGDAFPNFIVGVVVPCGIVIITSSIMQPIAARITQHRLKKIQNSVATQIQRHA